MPGYEQIQSGVAAVATICVAAAGLAIVGSVSRKAGQTCDSEKMLEFRVGIMRSCIGGSVMYGFLVTLVIISLASAIGMSAVVASGQHVPHANVYAGWGQPSSIAFCEADFAYSALVAEPTNALTSMLSFVPLSLLGICGLSREAPHGELRFVMLYLAFGAIGLGSTLLHTTLRAPMQAADELPMLWGCTALAFHFADDFLASHRLEQLRLYLPAASWGVVLLQTVGYYFVQEVFAFFAVACLVVVFTSFAYLGSKAWRVVGLPAASSPEDLAARHVMVPMMVAAGAIGVAALTCWALEMFGCVPIVEGQLLGSVAAPLVWKHLLHPAWHLLGSLSLWAGGQTLVVMWGLRIGWTRPCVSWLGIPVVVYRSKTS